MRLISAELRFRSLLLSAAGWRRGCQMVSELVTGLRGLGRSLARVIVRVQFLLTQCLSPSMYI